MKKILLLAFVVVFTISLSTVNASNPDKKKTIKKEITKVDKETAILTEAEVQTMLQRIDEIKQMDTKMLTRVEKRELRKEVRDIRNKLETNDGFSIYIGGGALLAIILLIILL